MECIHCGHDNQEGSRLCTECGNHLVIYCTWCGEELDPLYSTCPVCKHFILKPHLVPQKDPDMPQYSPRRRFLLVAMILSIVLLPILPLVFPLIAWRMGTADLALYSKDPIVRAARRTGKICTIVSIPVMVYETFYLVIMGLPFLFTYLIQHF